MKKRGNQVGFKSSSWFKKFENFFYSWYNLPIKSDREVYTMEEKRECNRDLKSLRSCLCKLSDTQFSVWMDIPEFIDRIERQVSDGRFLSRSDILEIMKETYEELKGKYSSRSFGPSRFKAIKNSINRIESETQKHGTEIAV